MKRGTSQPRTSLVFPVYRTSTEPEPELNLTLLDTEVCDGRNKKTEATGEDKSL
jgi:hypothetical protein